MLSKEVVIKNKVGLQSKTAAVFIHKANNFKSNIWIEKDERKANGKSLLGLLSLAIGADSKVMITADGEDEDLALQVLEEYLTTEIEEE